MEFPWLRDINEGCRFSISEFRGTNARQFNKCPQHKDVERFVLSCGENCPVSFFYVYPLDEKDTRQWFGCVNNITGLGHNHPSPVDWKLMSKKKTDIRKAQKSNQGNKPKDFQKGFSLDYEPMLVDPVASHSGIIYRELKRSSSFAVSGNINT